MKVSIIGAGNGGLTVAYWIAKNKHDVLLADVKKFSTQIDAIKKNGGKIKALKAYDKVSLVGDGQVENIIATTNFKKAAEFSKIIIIICPSFAQEVLFRKMLPYLNDEHIVVTLPGNYAALALIKFKNDNGYKKLNLTFVDGISIPFACRIIGPAVIAILGIKSYLSVSVYPDKGNSFKIINDLSKLLDLKFKKLTNPIVAGLENINFGGHPLMTICNIALLENFDGNFDYYKDCSSPATAAACIVMDNERLSVGKAYGWKLLSELDAMNSLYNDNKKTVYDFNRDSVTHNKLHSSPNSSQHRYITEDTAYLLVPCYQLAKKAGIELPVVKSLVIIAGAYNGVDYFQEGRSLKKLGIDKMSAKKIKEIFK